MQLTYDVFTSHMHEAADYIKNIIGKKVDIAVVLGSGLSGFADRMFSTGYTEIDYERVPFMAKTSVSGHSGKVLVGKWEIRQFYVSVADFIATKDTRRRH